MAQITTIRFTDELYDRLKLYVYSRKMLEPSISMAKVVERALLAYLDKDTS